MKANRLWAIWAHLMLALVIALELAWIIYASIFLVPKFQKLTDDGVIDAAIAEEFSAGWMLRFLDFAYDVGTHYRVWLALAAFALAGLFEWRVKSENKALMRLSAWGTLAAALMVVSALMAASLAEPNLLSGPVTSRMAVTFSKVQVDHLDASISALQQASAKKDWDAMKEPADRAAQALFNLDKAGPAVRALRSPKSLTVEELRAHVKGARGTIIDVRQAIEGNDTEQLEAGLQKLRQAAAPLRAAADLAR